MISILIPYYKTEQYIDKCISSILQQTFKNFEIIVIDDEQSNTSRKKLFKIKKKSKKIKVYKSKVIQSGVSACRNLAINKSKGQYIAFLDSDDFWHKKKLADQLLFMRKNKLFFSYTHYFDVKKNQIIRKITSLDNNFNSLLKQCDIGTSSVMIKKNNLKLYFNEELKTKEDYCLWLSLAKKKIKMKCLKKFYMFHTIRNNSLSGREMNKIFSAFIIYFKYMKINFFFFDIFYYKTLF